MDSVLLLQLVASVVVVGAVVLPVSMVFRMEARRAADPRFLREVGIVVVNLRAFDRVSEVIGRYMDADIYGEVFFKGLRYEFDRIVRPDYKADMVGAELYIEPGMVYVAR